MRQRSRNSFYGVTYVTRNIARQTDFQSHCPVITHSAYRALDLYLTIIIKIPDGVSDGWTKILKAF